MQTSLILAAVACAVIPARAQTRGVPAVTRAQYGVTVEPCFEKPMVQPDGSRRLTTGDGDCGRPPVEPPLVQPGPLPLPCPDDGCGAPPRRPDPCWYDDCPPGRGWDGGWRIQKEALRGGDFAARQNALNALFDNMASKVSGGGAVFAGDGGKRLPVAALAAAYSPVPVRSKISAVPVPSPRGARLVLASDDTDANPMNHDNAIREAGTWGAGGAAGGVLGGVPGVAVGGAAGAITGAASGYAADLKDKQERDEDTYRRGTDAWQKTHEDYLRRQQEDDE